MASESRENTSLPLVVLVAGFGPGIGYGHAMRSLALFAALPDTVTLHWICTGTEATLPEAKTLAKSVLGFDRACDMEVTLVDALSGILPETFAIATGFALHEMLVILDSYSVPTEVVQAWRTAGAIVLQIDDLAQPPLAAHAVLNHGAVPESAYRPWFKGQVAVGTQYALLRPPFHKAPIPSPQRDNYILVCMGGADPDGYTGRIATELLAAGHKVLVVMGPAYQGRAMGVHARLAVHHNPNPKALAALLQRAACAVLPASTMAYEAAMLRTPLAVVQTADNQAVLFAALVQGGVAVAYGEDSIEAFLQDAAALSTQKSSQQAAFDGQQQARQRAFVQYVWQENSTIAFARATPADEALTLAWANDADTRRAAFSQTVITPEGHAAYYAAQLASADVQWLIARRGGEAVGQVRFNKQSEGVWLISYLVAPVARGRGYAQRLLQGAAAALKEELAETDVTLLAYVKLENEASLKAFRRLGYLEHAPEMVQGAECARFTLIL